MSIISTNTGERAQWLHSEVESGGAYQSSWIVLFLITERIVAQRWRKSRTITSARPAFAKAQYRQFALHGYDRPSSGGHSTKARTDAVVFPWGHWSKRIAVASERSHSRGAFSSVSQGRLLTNRLRSAHQNRRTVGVES